MKGVFGSLLWAFTDPSKAPPPKVITLKIRISTYEFQGDTGFTDHSTRALHAFWNRLWNPFLPPWARLGMFSLAQEKKMLYKESDYYLFNI